MPRRDAMSRTRKRDPALERRSRLAHSRYRPDGRRQWRCLARSRSQLPAASELFELTGHGLDRLGLGLRGLHEPGCLQRPRLAALGSRNDQPVGESRALDEAEGRPGRVCRRTDDVGPAYTPGFGLGSVTCQGNSGYTAGEGLALAAGRGGLLRSGGPESNSPRVRAGRDVLARDAEAVVPLTQEEIAELAGTSRATVNRVLYSAERNGTFELRRARTAVVDLEGLARRGR
jgi:hypothetical protein